MSSEKVFSSFINNFQSNNFKRQAVQPVVSIYVNILYLCCLKNFTIVNDDYLLGYIWDERIDKIFLIDKTAGILYLGEPHPFNKLGNVIGICEEGIISCIYPGDYLTYKKDLQLPEEIKQHLNNEGVVLRLYSFNNKNKSK